MRTRLAGRDGPSLVQPGPIMHAPLLDSGQDSCSLAPVSTISGFGSSNPSMNPLVVVGLDLSLSRVHSARPDPRANHAVLESKIYHVASGTEYPLPGRPWPSKANFGPRESSLPSQIASGSAWHYSVEVVKLRIDRISGPLSSYLGLDRRAG
ncbi:hypothetical protein BDV10DRAFT_175773 [Aspergillus recurvatus]